MKLKLTRRWKNCLRSKTSLAFTEGVALKCEFLYQDSKNVVTNYWVGSASMVRGYPKYSPRRKSVEKARQDAENIAIELLQDVRKGARELMEFHGMGEGD